MAVNII